MPDELCQGTVLPFEGEVADADGVPIQIILFQRDGKLTNLEFVIFSDRMKRFPRAADIEVRHGGDTWAGRRPPPSF